MFCSSVLLHLTDPIKALWRIQSVTRETAIFASWKWISEFRLDYRDGRPGTYHGIIQASKTSKAHPSPAAGQDLGSMVQTPDTPTKLRLELAKRGTEIKRLKELVAGYERGRFIRLMRHIDKWRREAPNE